MPAWYNRIVAKRKKTCKERQEIEAILEMLADYPEPNNKLTHITDCF